MLMSFGWTEDRQRDFDSHHSGLTPARVVEQHRGAYRVVDQHGERTAHVSGRLAFDAAPGALPAVGDWVALAIAGDAATIQRVLPRTSAFQRHAHGRLQTICANLDVALLVTALNGDFNPRRLERYLAVAREGGAAPVVLLTKSDLCTDIEARRAEIVAIAGAAPVLAISALTGDGLDQLAAHLPPGKTAALLGSSGVGKSTLVNALAGADLMQTRAISGDDKRGRHTTTHRELFLLPSGALLLDSPGLRELSVADANAGVAATFEDVEAIAGACRFSDCSHGGEPGCAVAGALESGALDAARWASYQKLQRELAFEARKDDPEARAAHREGWMRVAKAYRAQKKFRDRQDED
jgi:ribosome biogenesis GTPase